MLNSDHANYPRASFLRRLGAMMYDSLLAVAVYMFSGAVGFGIFIALHSSGLIAMDGYEDVSSLLSNTPIYHGLYQLWIALCVGGFYAIFWNRGGQTLGMRAWRLKVQHPNGQNLSFITACARVVWSLLGIGNLWIIINDDKLALQDMMTRSEVVVLSVEANKMRHWHGA